MIVVFQLAVDKYNLLPRFDLLQSDLIRENQRIFAQGSPETLFKTLLGSLYLRDGDAFLL